MKAHNLTPITRRWLSLTLAIGLSLGLGMGGWLLGYTRTPTDIVSQTESVATTGNSLAEQDSSLNQIMMDGSAETAGTSQNNKPQVIKYTVQQGDTVWAIANKFGTDVDSILSINELDRNGYLKLGQELKILTVKGTIHKVKPGDTLSSIASQYEVDQQVILTANNLPSADKLFPGEELIIPGAKVTRPAVRVASASRGDVSRSKYTQQPSKVEAGFIWPVRGPITSSFGMRWGRMHNAIDIAARIGTPIVAAKSGKVIFSGWDGSYGRKIVIQHAGGIETVYAHNTANLVQVGDTVSQGQQIATVGITGFTTGPHLHFEVHVNGTPVNPLTYLP